MSSPDDDGLDYIRAIRASAAVFAFGLIAGATIVAVVDGPISATMLLLGSLWTMSHFRVIAIGMSARYVRAKTADISAVLAMPPGQIGADLEASWETLRELCATCPNAHLAYDAMKALGRLSIAVRGGNCRSCGVCAPLRDGECPDCCR